VRDTRRAKDEGKITSDRVRRERRVFTVDLVPFSFISSDLIDRDTHRQRYAWIHIYIYIYREREREREREKDLGFWYHKITTHLTSFSVVLYAISIFLSPSRSHDLYRPNGF